MRGAGKFGRLFGKTSLVFVVEQVSLLGINFMRISEEFGG